MRLHSLVSLSLSVICFFGAAQAVAQVENLDTTEVFATIQAAIDDADTLSGHTLAMTVSAHSTPELQIVFSKDLTLQGDASGTTLSPTLDTGTVGDARGWFLVPLGRTVAFRDLTFDGTPNKVHTAIRNHGALTVEKCAFTRIQFDASGPSYAGIGISHFDAGGAAMTVSDCKFSEIGRIGIHVFEPATIMRCSYAGKGMGNWLDYFACVDSFGASIGVATFDACSVSGNRGVALSDGSTSAGLLITTFFGAGTDATLVNCSFTDSTVGIAVGFDAADTSTVDIDNCTIAGNDFGLVNTSSSTIVDATGNWWGDASGPEDPTGTFEAAPGPVNCYAASFTRTADVMNADGGGNSVTDANVDYCPWLAGPPLLFDQDVIPDVIFGSGNANGSYTVDHEDCVELGLRGKLRYPASNDFHSNGDGTYTFNTGSGSGPGSGPPKSEWSFEWSVNTDFDGGSGFVVGDLTYAIGMDNDPGAGTDYLVFDPISIGTIIPYTPPSPPVPFWDHSMGDNGTPNGGGAEAGDGATYATYLATLTVAQNSWQPTFFQNFAPFSWDPDVPGRYEYYLAAFSGGTEIARTAISIFAVDGISLTLEADPCQTDQDAGTAGVQIVVELRLRNPDELAVTGWQAFLAFDDLAMAYEGASSFYSAAPFEVHVTPTASAEVASGELQLDGNTFSSPLGTMADELLATLVFTVLECDLNGVSFDLSQPFESEASFSGTPYTTELVGASSIVADVTPPVLVGTPADITQAADAGSCADAIVAWTGPTATDNCDPSPAVACVPPSGSTFPVGTTTVTCTATDDCGNSSTSTFDVTVTATNLVDVIVELTGSMPTTRCIHFVADGCSTVADVPLVFTGTAPAVAMATIEVPCGSYTTLCAKDEQHTQWASSPLAISGSNYVATSTIVLDGGDTDNDGDIDINDITLFISQFGSLDSPGGCPWDGTKDADFSNNGAVLSEDYTFLVVNWLTLSSCSGCTLPVSGGGDRSRRLSVDVHDPATAAADLDGDGRVDVRDVELFEQAHGLSGELSRLMRP